MSAQRRTYPSGRKDRPAGLLEGEHDVRNRLNTETNEEGGTWNDEKTDHSGFHGIVYCDDSASYVGIGRGARRGNT